MNAQVETTPAAASRFVKIGADGQPLPADAKEWEGVCETRTGLMWAAQSIAVDDYDECEPKLKELRAAGFSDWRLPTIDELFALADRSRVSPAIDVGFFPDTESDWYWTSTPYADSPSGYAWGVGFGGGYAVYCGRDSSGFVRAVRVGQ